MKKLIYTLLALNILFLSACKKEDVEPTLEEKNQQILAYIAQNNLTAQQTSSGIYYVSLETGESTRGPEIGDQLTLAVEGTNLNGQELTQNPNLKLPFGANILNQGLEDVLELFKKGDKVKVFLSNVNPVAVYDVTLTDIRSEEEQIEDYITGNELSTSSTDSGIEYSIETQGTGEAPSPNDIVLVIYVLRDLEGNIIDQSSASGTNFTLSTTSLIAGFYESVLLLNEGGKGKFIMPSSLAYGVTGNRNILPYTPLVFEIELVSTN